MQWSAAVVVGIPHSTLRTPDYFLRGLLAAVDAKRNSDAAVGVASKSETRNGRGSFFDLPYEVKMANVILRHHAGPAGDVKELRLAGKAKQLGQLTKHNSSDFFVVQLAQLGL